MKTYNCELKRINIDFDEITAVMYSSEEKKEFDIDLSSDLSGVELNEFMLDEMIDALADNEYEVSVNKKGDNAKMCRLEKNSLVSDIKEIADDMVVDLDDDDEFEYD